jgi:CheY-like chemotaxis protein
MNHILLIDDEEEVRSTWRDMLEQAGYEVAEAANGRQAVTMFETDPAEMVITDIIMPELDGIDMIIELRRRWPSVQIVAISGGGISRQLNILELSKKVGADRVLAKPVTANDLTDTVQGLLDQKTTDYYSDVGPLGQLKIGTMG